MRTTLVTLGIVLANLSSSFAKVAYADEGGAPPPASATEDHGIAPDGRLGAGSDSKESAPEPAPPPRGFADLRVITGWSRWEPIAPGYHRSPRPRTGLVIAGVVVLGSGYLLSIYDAALVSGFSSGNTNTSVGTLLVPVVGPFIEIGQSASAVWTPFFILDGLTQLGGIAMIVVGLNVPKTVLVPNEYGASTGFQFSFVPIVAPGRQGLGLVGTF